MVNEDEFEEEYVPHKFFNREDQNGIDSEGEVGTIYQSFIGDDDYDVGTKISSVGNGISNGSSGNESFKRILSLVKSDKVKFVRFRNWLPQRSYHSP